MVTTRSEQGSRRRRSTRVSQSVMLRVTGIDGNGRPFIEQTGTLALSSQGCSYFSKQALSRNAWVSLEILDEQTDSSPRRSQARVAWVRKSRNLPGLFQVGVEFEAPGNVWGLSDPPEDWRPPGVSTDSSTKAFEREMKECLALIETGNYYQWLQVTALSTDSQVRHNYYHLVRKFHPDRHMASPGWTEALHKIMDAITTAYKTLTDDEARRKYDARLAKSGAFVLSRNRSDSQKTAAECAEKAQECLRAQNYGGCILWLRRAVEIEPKSAKYLTLLGGSLSASAPFRREALELLQKAVEIDPWNAAAHLHIAALYEEMKLPWRARSYYQKVLAIDAGHEEAQERLRLLDAETGKQKTARGKLMDRLFPGSRK
jgi:tetratricopeptide (TPR) repeat protein